MNVSVNMRGESQLIETLKELGGVQAGKALRGALSFVSGRMAKRFRDKAPKRSGALGRSFKHAERIFGQEGQIKSWVGVSAKFVEKGVLEKVEYEGATGKKTRWRVSDKRPILYVRRIEESSKNAGWMRATWYAEIPAITASIKGDVWKKITAFARRRAKKTR